MKRLMQKMLVLVVALIAWGNIYGKVSVEDFWYELNETEKTAEVTGLALNYGGAHSYKIPDKINHNGTIYKVTRIAKRAFHSKGLYNISIPSSIKYIGADAFKGSKLDKIYIEDMGSWCKIEFDTHTANPFSHYPDMQVYQNDTIVENLVISDNVSMINNWAFYYCKSLKSVVMSDNVVGVGEYSFYGCSNLESINVSPNVKYIGKYAFGYCTKLVTFNGIPEDVTEINEGTFYNCLELTLLNIPNGLRHIGEDAFGFCGIVSIKIPNGVTSIDKRAFDNCFNLTEVVLSNTLTHIKDYAFSDCIKLRSITIPRSVTYIGNGVFDGCTELQSIFVEEGNTVYESRDKNRALVMINDKYVVFAPEIVIEYECVSSTQTTLTFKVSPDENEEFESYGIRDSYKYQANKNGIVTISNLRPNSSGYYSAYAIRDEVLYYYHSYEVNPKTLDIVVDCNSTATATAINATGSFDIGDATFKTSGFTSPYSMNGNDILLTGLEPNTTQTVSYYVTVEEENYTKEQTLSVTTPALTLTTLKAKATSNSKAVICAETNIANEETGTGFEWRRIDAPDLVPSEEVYCAVHDGVMEGILNNLSANTYYKYRPFYKSAAGNMYYGEWIGFGTADAYVYFTPTVHTYATAKVENNTATLSGYALAGSDDIVEQGFEYWADGFAGTRAAGEVMTVAATGQRMNITLNGLAYNTTYKYRAYVKTAKETTYGEEMSFSTGDDPMGINEVLTEDLSIEIRTMQGSIELRQTGGNASARYVLYTLNGTAIANGQLSTGEAWQHIGDAALPQGLYLLRVEDGKQCRTVKVMLK